TTIEQDFTNAFTKFGKNRNTIQLQTTYADYLTFYKNQPEQATLVLEKAMNFASSRFEKAKIKLKLGEVLVFTNKFNKALIYFSQIQTRFKNHELAQEARFKVAQTSYFKGDFKWAKAQLKVLKSSATQLIANDAVDLFLTISDNYPKDSVPTGLTQLAKADLLAYQNKNKEALTVLTNILTNEELLSRNGGFLQITNAVLYKKAMLYIKQGKYTEAVADLEKVIATSKPDGIFMDDSVYQLA
ncbi:MAG: tetratricopeptide repeat protein, partial [Tenacibaculum sp.]